MAGIVLEGVTKRFSDGTVAVRDLDLEIDDGEFMVLVGPSGCGKTTALRMVAGLEEVTSGTIRIGDRVVNDLAPRDRDIAMVFQNYALYPHMTVFENMAFGLKLRKIAKAEIRRRVEEAAALLAIGELLGKRPRQLSGGQRQRVAMGRAIVREPAAFLMDEPLSNLDARLRVQVRAEIGRLHQRLQTTTVYVTHDQTEAMTMADRVAVMRRGTLQQVDTPRALYDNPANLFVGGFIGSPPMNLIVADLIREDGKVLAAFGGHRLAVPPAALERRLGLARYLGGETILGIRPEDLEDASFTPHAGAGQVLEAVMALTEPMGAEVVAHFEVDAPPVTAEQTRELATDLDRQSDRTTFFTARLHPRTTAAEGQALKLAVDLDRLYFFDPETGETIR